MERHGEAGAVAPLHDAKNNLFTFYGKAVSGIALSSR
jgi:hypothetical protein